jgi:hypothetical protein
LLPKAPTTLPVVVLISAISFTAVPLTEVNWPPIYASAQLPPLKAIVLTKAPATSGAHEVTVCGVVALKLKMFSRV